MKQLLAFDLDGTLTPSKTAATDRMAEVFAALLDQFDMCIISGGKFEQFQKQILNSLRATPEQLRRLHLMPTCGTRYMVYDAAKKDWRTIYAEDFTPAEKKKIAAALHKGFDDLGYRQEKVYGETVEDRGSQITYSVLGQDIVDVLGEKGLRMKEEWDPDDKIKNELRDYIAPLIPEFEVRVGGITSIDVTKQGVDKAYGMKKLCEILEIGKEDILFIGDRIREGGNDYPVKLMGIDTIQVGRWEDTAYILEGILKVL